MGKRKKEFGYGYIRKLVYYMLERIFKWIW